MLYCRGGGVYYWSATVSLVVCYCDATVDYPINIIIIMVIKMVTVTFQVQKFTFLH